MNNKKIIPARCLPKGVDVYITKITTEANGTNGKVLATWEDFKCSHSIGCAEYCKANTHMANHDESPKQWL